jgi:hypothetical protein
MPPTAPGAYSVGMDTLFTILHVVAAVFIVGPMAILPTTGLRALRAGQGGQVTTLAKSVVGTTIASVVVVILGFAAMGLADPKYNLSIATPWIWISLIAWAAACAVTMAFVVPAMRKAGAQLTDGGTVAASAYPRIAAGSGVATLLLVLVVVLMAWRP